MNMKQEGRKKIENKLYNQILKMINFMLKNSLVFHPMHSLEERAKTIVKLGHCICDFKRQYCPCLQALEEIKKEGHCLCWIFFSKEGLLNYYEKK